jgi:hypothetical protein
MQARKFLISLHYVGCFAQLLACFTVFTLFGVGNFRLDFSLTHKQLVEVDAYKNRTCDGIVYTEVEPWLRCVDPSGPLPPPMTFEEVSYIEPVKGGIAIVVGLLCLFSAMFHLYCIITKTAYLSHLSEGKRPLRWLEYSITYTIMTVCMFQLSNVDDAHVTLLLLVSSIALALLGFGIESLRRVRAGGAGGGKRESLPSERRAFKVLELGSRPWIYSEVDEVRDLYGDMFVMAVLVLGVVCIMCVHFVVLWDSFRHTFVPYLRSDAGVLWVQLWGHIIVLNVVMYGMYCFQGVVHAVVFFSKGKNVYVYAEVANLLLSLSSKLLLIVIVCAGAQRQPE